MHKSIFAITLACCLATPAQAETSPAFEEARDFVMADKVGSALLVIGVGAMGINDQDDGGCSLLHYAAKTGSLEAVTELLRAGADPTLAAKDGTVPSDLATSDALRKELTTAAEEWRAKADRAPVAGI